MSSTDGPADLCAKCGGILHVTAVEAGKWRIECTVCGDVTHRNELEETT